MARPMQPSSSFRPSVFALVVWALLLTLTFVGVWGIDLQFVFLSVIWPIFAGFDKYDRFVHWIEPSRTIAHAPLVQPLFGWPACLICLVAFGVRHRYRRALPVGAFVLLSLFGMFVCVLVYELGALTLGIQIRRHWKAGDWQSVVAALVCNIAIACVVWRWTRSRLMLVGLIALAMLGPVQHAAGRCQHYFTRYITMPSHGSGPSSVMPSSFDSWVGPDLVDSWFNRAMHALLDGSFAQKSVSFPIAYETYIDHEVGVDVVKKQWRHYVYINIPFVMTYNTGVLMLAYAAVIRSRRSEELRCFHCDYDFTGLPARSPCPECGVERPPESPERPLPV